MTSDVATARFQYFPDYLARRLLFTSHAASPYVNTVHTGHSRFDNSTFNPSTANQSWQQQRYYRGPSVSLDGNRFR